MATVAVIVNNGVYLSLQDREFEPSIGLARSNIALDVLQGLFDEYRDLIPFSSTIEHISNFNELLLTAFVQVDYVDYWLGNVKTVLRYLDRIKFNEEKDILNLRTFPEAYYFDQLTQSIEVYPLPTEGQNNWFEVSGLVGLPKNISLTTQIPPNMPRFFRDFFDYELGSRLANMYGSDWEDNKEKTRLRLKAQATSKREINITPKARLDVLSPTAKSLYPPYFYYQSGGGAQ